MQDMPKRVVIGSMAVAGIVALAAISDLVAGVPFAGAAQTRLMDILFIVSSGIVIYLAWSVFKELS